VCCLRVGEVAMMVELIDSGRGKKGAERGDLEVGVRSVENAAHRLFCSP
jgi:hypothetical protein